MAMDATLLKSSARSAARASAEPNRAADKPAESSDQAGFSRALADARSPARADGPKTSADSRAQSTSRAKTAHNGTAHKTEKDPTSAGSPPPEDSHLLANIDSARASASSHAAGKAADASRQNGRTSAPDRPDPLIPAAGKAGAAPVSTVAADATGPNAVEGGRAHGHAAAKHKKAGDAAANQAIGIATAPLTAQAQPEAVAAEHGARQASAHVQHARRGHDGKIDPRLVASDSSAAAASGKQQDVAAQAAVAQTAANESAQVRNASALATHFLRDDHRAGHTQTSRGSDNLFASSLAQTNHAAGSAPSAQAIAPAATYNIAAPLGSDAWQTSISQHSLRLAANGGGRAELTLHPRELGQIQVSLKLDASNQAQLHFVSPHAHVREAIEAAMPQLRQAFAAGGLALGQASVGDQSQPRSGEQFSGDSRRRTRTIDGALAVTNDTPVLAGVPNTPAPARALRGGVDTFA